MSKKTRTIYICIAVVLMAVLSPFLYRIAMEGRVENDWQKIAAEIERSLPAPAARGAEDATSGTQENILAGKFHAQLVLNQSTYNIGEPIIATLILTNVSTETLNISTCHSSIGERMDDLSLLVRDAQGTLAFDPLKIFVNSEAMLESARVKQVDSGKSMVINSMLNFYAEPRKPGTYSLSGEMRVMEGQRWCDLPIPAVMFRVRDWNSRMFEWQARRLFNRYDFDALDTCILYGLQNRTEKISKLLEPLSVFNYWEKLLNWKCIALAANYYEGVMRKIEWYYYSFLGGKRPYNGVNTPLYFNRRGTNALMSLLLIPDKTAVYRALARKTQEKDEKKLDGEKCFGWSHRLYMLAASPDALPELERQLDHPNQTVRRAALCAALSMGSGKALAMLPKVPCGKDEDEECFLVRVREAALKFLEYTTGRSYCRLESLSGKMAPRYGDALLDSFTMWNITSTDQVSIKRREVDMHRFIDAFRLNGGRFVDLVDMVICSDSAIKQRVLVQYFCTVYFRFQKMRKGLTPGTGELDKNQEKRLISFFRRQAETQQDLSIRACAVECLGYLEDGASIPLLERYLDCPDVSLRAAAAQSLIFMRHEPLLSRSIDRLVDEDDTTQSMRVAVTASNLGCDETFELGHPLPGDPVAELAAKAAGIKDMIYLRIPSTPMMRERQKAALREWCAKPKR